LDPGLYFTASKQTHKNKNVKEIFRTQRSQRKEGFKQEFSNLTKPHYKRTCTTQKDGLPLSIVFNEEMAETTSNCIFSFTSYSYCAQIELNMKKAWSNRIASSHRSNK